MLTACTPDLIVILPAPVFDEPTQDEFELYESIFDHLPNTADVMWGTN